MDNEDWDKEFWRLAGVDPSEVDQNSEGPSNFAILKIDDIPEYAEYLQVLVEKERLEINRYRSEISLVNSRAGLNSAGIIGVIASILFGAAWTIWYWVH